MKESNREVGWGLQGRESHTSARRGLVQPMTQTLKLDPEEGGELPVLSSASEFKLPLKNPDTLTDCRTLAGDTEALHLNDRPIMPGAEKIPE